MMIMALKSLALLFFIQGIATLPTNTHDAELALITPAPDIPQAVSNLLNKRGVISDITAAVNSFDNSILSGLGSNLPSYVTDGLLPGFQGYPTGSSAVLSSVGVSSSDLDAQPTQVLNIPGYGNWTDGGWNLRIHGNVYKAPANVSNSTWNDLANKFLIGTSVQALPPTESAQALNVTQEIFVVQQGNQTVQMNIELTPPQGSGGSTASGASQSVILPNVTTPEGDFDTFVQLQNLSGYNAGNGSIPAQQINVYANGTLTGNATSYLVSDTGLTIVNDIDDILRVTKIYEPSQGIFNTFAAPFTPWMNMPDIYANWSRSIPTMHFHYLTTTPEQISRTYMQFIYDTYPGGSFDDRPLNFSDVSATLSIRKFLLDKIFQTFPNRKFILVADTSNSDVMRDYPQMVFDYPGQVQCIFLRNTSSTDPGDRFPYNTSGFKDINQQTYMFFNVPDDLLNLDIENGQCYNSSVKQNLTFSEQGLPFGLTSTNNSNGSSGGQSSASAIGQSGSLLTYIFAIAGFTIFHIFL